MKSWLKITLIFLCFFFIFRYFSGHKEELNFLSSLSLTRCAYLFLLFLMLQALGSYRHFIIVKNLGIGTLPALEWFKIFITSKFINFHILQGANIYRGVQLKNKYRFSYTKTISLITTFSWFESLAILALTVLLIILTKSPSDALFRSIVTLLTATAVFLSLAPFLIKAILSKMRLKEKKLVWLHGKLQELTVNITEQVKNIRLVLLFSFLTALIFLINVLAIMACLPSADNQLSMAGIALFAATLRLSRTINIVPGNLGLTEILCGAISQLIGESIGQGILIAGILRVSEYVIVGILAFIMNFPTAKKGAADA